ncbi:hypothetical protein H5410_056605 [Solanum commersonii]|uniref:Uncharacterized protein n=1 Tax=Solanum commersonii TaxID=4109 RepID=A0A9J5WMP0_SOLCO|nr:hypothetical protein H5410_056605 [Solanum commersonii]
MDLLAIHISNLFLLNFFVDIQQDLSYATVHGSFGDLDFLCHLVLMTSTKFSIKMTSKILMTKRSMDYSTQKVAKLGVYSLWDSFDLENGMIFPSEPIGSIAKVLTDVHEIFWQK